MVQGTIAGRSLVVASASILAVFLAGGCANVSEILSFDIISPEDGAELNVNVLEVSGIADTAAVVTVNGVEVEVAEGGTFCGYVELEEGVNTIEVLAVCGTVEISETITVIFSPALAVYLKVNSPASNTNLVNTPLQVNGAVSNPGATVTVNRNQTAVDENGSFFSDIQLVVGQNNIEAVATLNQEQDNWIISVGLNEEGHLEYVPGLGPGEHLYESRVLCDESVELRAGETKSLRITLESGKAGSTPSPMEFSSTISRVEAKYSEDTLPWPEGLELVIEPPSFTAYPNTTYHSNLNIITSSELGQANTFSSSRAILKTRRRPQCGL